MRGWVRSGVLARVFEALQQEQIIRIKVEAASLDSTSVKVHPDGTGALKRTARRASDDPAEDSRPGFIRLPQMLRSREANGQSIASASQPVSVPRAGRPPAP